MEKFYKLRHKPTGLFFKPVGSEYIMKSNFHKDGKVYTKKPSINHVDSQLWMRANHKSSLVKLDPSEWEVVTFEVREVEATSCG